MARIKRHELCLELQGKATAILQLADDVRLVDQLNDMLNPGIDISFVKTKNGSRLEINCESNDVSSIHIITEGDAIFIESQEADPRAGLILRRIEGCIHSAMKHIPSS